LGVEECAKGDRSLIDPVAPRIPLLTILGVFVVLACVAGAFYKQSYIGLSDRE
jgi:hypothetical protein